jgi:hypothetical protein
MVVPHFQRKVLPADCRFSYHQLSVYEKNSVPEWELDLGFGWVVVAAVGSVGV